MAEAILFYVQEKRGFTKFDAPNLLAR
jgi:hypothetical protein